MNLVHLRCPDCGAELEVDNSREFCFCQYCGTKIILEESDASVRRTKARLKTIDKFLDQREAQQIRKMENRRIREETKAEERRLKAELQHKRQILTVIISVILFVLMAIICFYPNAFAESTASTDTYRSDAVQLEYQTPEETHLHNESHYEYHELS